MNHDVGNPERCGGLLTVDHDFRVKNLLSVGCPRRECTDYESLTIVLRLGDYLIKINL